MQKNKLPSNSQYVIITVKQPLMFHQTDDEAWVFNPQRRYIINAARIPQIHDYIESVSEMDGAALVNKLQAGKTVHGASILVERFRERGIGDLLFLSGPLRFIHHMSGGTAKIDLYAYSDRGMVLQGAPYLRNGTVLCGPIEYDSLRVYNYHWLVGSVTECDEESDQLNVYDALYRQLGFNHEDIEPQWKRPHAVVTTDDYQNLDQFYRSVMEHRKIDLRRIGYYVVAPFANATLRCMNYSQWLQVITELSKRRPVVVVGNTKLRLPDTDMTAGAFLEQAARIGGGVIMAVDTTPLRVLMALIARATCVVCMDSSPLYIAQALGTPAISVWGTHDPGVRIGYDPNYMRLAIWNEGMCHEAPCYAYSEFPHHKCPRGTGQQCCEVLSTVTVQDVLDKMNIVEATGVFANESSGTKA